MYPSLFKLFFVFGLRPFLVSSRNASMAWLTRFPLEVIEDVTPLLRDHHLARLYMSGDRRLQHLLRGVRSRKCRLIGTSVGKSQLVEEFIIGAAADVATQFVASPARALASIRRG
jgi:hypothetical protein